MLTAKAQYSLRNAEKYFEEHLSAGDYYAEGKQVPGEWFGAGARTMGLQKRVRMDDFVKLCRNVDPRTDARLTQRQKSQNRRVFYDFTLSPPKSVSIAALVAGDRRIEESHERAARTALAELERFAAGRVRKNGASSYRRTGNVAGAMFHHDTSRALDPHLHSHCIIFNATRDEAEERWKALETYDMLGACKYAENVYYHELARDLRSFGYELENTRRGDFEIKGVSRELIARFSKRHNEIDRQTEELLNGSPEKRGNVKAVRENLARKNRARKIKEIGRQRLVALWDGQMSTEEKAVLSKLRQGQQANRRKSPKTQVAANAAVSWAEQHLFDRRSVVNEFEIWRHALEHGRGQGFSLKHVQAVTKRRSYIRNEAHPRKVTTKPTLDREKEIVARARDGRDRFAPFNARHTIRNGSLDPEQCQAVMHILASRNFVTLFRGAAGTGKSFTLKEVRAGLTEAGHRVQVLAPQRQQVIDLSRDLGADGQTVSEFLTRREMDQGGVVIVDEAGQIGAKQMLQLLEFVGANGGRVILSGDTRQHGPVEASDALRAIEKYGELEAAELTTIRRQDPNLAKSREERRTIKQYRLAVDEARNGQFKESFDRLNQNGAIRQCGLFEQQDFLTRRYLELAAQELSTVVVSQTWSEIHNVNQSVREGSRQQGLIGGEDTVVESLHRLDLTDAQKRDKRFYSDTSVMILNRDVAGLKRGAHCRLVEMCDDCLIVEGSGKIRRISFEQLDRVTVCEPKELALASGDRLQLKANAKTVDGRQIANGEIVTVKAVADDGRISLVDGRILPADYRQFVRGYAVTSYAAQGKTADFVIFSDSAIKAATNQKQWYVTISRGRRGIEIFTTDKRELRENVIRSGNRELALELAPDQIARVDRGRRQEI